MIKVGLLGYGSFGKKIESKLRKIDNIEIQWIYRSRDHWWKVFVSIFSLRSK